MRYFAFVVVLIMMSSCQKEASKTLLNGDYRATLEVMDGLDLPFNFTVTDNNRIAFYNAEEVIEVDEILYFNDSIKINFPVFEGYIVGKFADGKMSNAKFIIESLDRVVPMTVYHDNNQRFLNVKPTPENIEGVWQMKFVEQDGSTYIGKGIFKQDGNKMTGTIRTTTGDYRYLEGVVTGKEMKFSVFDGAHAFLFSGKIAGDNMKGTFYSGNHYKALFKGTRNPDFELPDENTLTFLKEGYDALEFSFPDLDGNMISLSDEQFQGEVVVVQLMGSWCPNCLDESKYYSQYFKDNPSKDLEFVALAFEYAKTPEKAVAGLKRLKERLDIDYIILLAQYGTSDKEAAQKKLPMLNHVLSYPTTIFIDKKGKVRKIHTGFNGPATGDKYLEFKKEFEGFVGELLAE